MWMNNLKTNYDHENNTIFWQGHTWCISPLHTCTYTSSIVGYTPTCHHVKINTHRLVAVLKVETDIISSISASPIGQSLIVEIMYVETFKSDRIVLIGDIIVFDVILINIVQYQSHSIDTGHITRRNQRENVQITNEILYTYVQAYKNYIQGISYTNLWCWCRREKNKWSIFFTFTVMSEFLIYNPATTTTYACPPHKKFFSKLCFLHFFIFNVFSVYEVCDSTD